MVRNSITLITVLLCVVLDPSWALFGNSFDKFIPLEARNDTPTTAEPITTTKLHQSTKPEVITSPVYPAPIYNPNYYKFAQYPRVYNRPNYPLISDYRSIHPPIGIQSLPYFNSSLTKGVQNEIILQPSGSNTVPKPANVDSSMEIQPHFIPNSNNPATGKTFLQLDNLKAIPSSLQIEDAITDFVMKKLQKVKETLDNKQIYYKTLAPWSDDSTELDSNETLPNETDGSAESDSNQTLPHETDDSRQLDFGPSEKDSNEEVDTRGKFSIIAETDKSLFIHPNDFINGLGSNTVLNIISKLNDLFEDQSTAFPKFININGKNCSTVMRKHQGEVHVMINCDKESFDDKTKRTSTPNNFNMTYYIEELTAVTTEPVKQLINGTMNNSSGLANQKLINTDPWNTESLDTTSKPTIQIRIDDIIYNIILNGHLPLFARCIIK